MSYTRVLASDGTSETFTVEGESYFLLKHPGGAVRVTLAVNFPDGSGNIPLLENLDESTEQRLVVPADTSFTITASTAGAEAWIAPIYRSRAGQLLGG